MWRVITLFTLLLSEILVSGSVPIHHRYSDFEFIVNNGYNPYITDNDLKHIKDFAADMNEEDAKQIMSMLDVYKDETLTFERNAVDTKYRTWKRNADLINSLLALPKDMHDAGRR